MNITTIRDDFLQIKNIIIIQKSRDYQRKKYPNQKIFNNHKKMSMKYFFNFFVVIDVLFKKKRVKIGHIRYYKEK